METHEVTTLLEAIRQGNGEAREQLCRLLCDELHAGAERCLHRERAGHTLQPTDLVNEVLLRLLDGEVLEKAPNRAYLFGAAATAMRRILVDHARKRNALQHGGGWQRTPLDDVVDGYQDQGLNLLDLHDCLERLQGLDPRQHQVFEEYHFGGYTLREIAEHLGVSEATVCNDLKHAQLWLGAEMRK